MALKDYRVKVSIRNNHILTRIEAAGFQSVKQFCGAFPSLKYTSICALVRMSTRASYKKINQGQWKPIAYELALLLGCEPEDLFTERQSAAFDRTSFEINADEAELKQLTSSSKWMNEIEIKEGVQRVLQDLRPRERLVFERRFGLDGDPPETLLEIGKRKGIGREQVRQIESKALRQLKHPSRRDILRELLR